MRDIECWLAAAKVRTRACVLLGIARYVSLECLQVLEEMHRLAESTTRAPNGARSPQ